MKKIISYILATVLVGSLALTAAATELTGCTISADQVTASAGETVTVPIRISDNSGFTNFAIAVDYDREQLELVSIDTADDNGTAYLCGEMVSTNLAWAAEENVTYGYITAASAEAIAGDGILFTVTFTVSENFSGTAEIEPIVSYIRNGAATLKVFEEITAAVTEGSITQTQNILLGDVNGDGSVTMSDMQEIYNVCGGAGIFSDEQFRAADVDSSGVVNMTDMQLVYQFVGGIISSFPTVE